jgi:ABC-type transporter Mla maintaining outer membrane lipid asymmetry ATPase subunit MlaF
MGYGFDMGGLLNNKTIFENLMLPLQYHKVTDLEDAAERVNQAIDMFGMTGAKDLRPFAVSGSVRKLACIMRAFLHWPQVVFLDDPLTGLKEDNVNDLIYYVEESFATRGLKQVIFTSESPTLAQKFKAEELLVSTDWFTTRSVA